MRRHPGSAGAGERDVHRDFPGDDPGTRWCLGGGVASPRPAPGELGCWRQEERRVGHPQRVVGVDLSDPVVPGRLASAAFA